MLDCRIPRKFWRVALSKDEYGIENGQEYERADEEVESPDLIALRPAYDPGQEDDNGKLGESDANDAEGVVHEGPFGDL